MTDYFTCLLCEKESCYVSKWCDKCHRLKRTIALYGDDVIEAVEKVFIRDKNQQNFKISTQLKKEIENKKKVLEKSKTNSVSM
jgi:hypothetical protein